MLFKNFYEKSILIPTKNNEIFEKMLFLFFREKMLKNHYNAVNGNAGCDVHTKIEGQKFKINYMQVYV